MTVPARRTFLRAVSAGLATAIAGCATRRHPGSGTRSPTSRPAPSATTGPTDSPAGSPTRSTPERYEITPPHPDACPSAGLETPTPTRELDPRPYPPYPESLTPTAAWEFVDAFESAYVHNWVVETDWMAGTDEIDVTGEPDYWTHFPDPDRFILHVQLTIRTGDTEPPGTGTRSATEVPHLLAHFPAWYYLGPTFALRDGYEQPDGPRSEEPSFVAADVIYCE